MTGTRILPLLSTSKISEAVGTLITPENADAEARMLIRIIYAVTNFENPEQANLADEAIKAAYRMTTHFHRAVENSLGEFIGESIGSSPTDFKQEKSGEPSLIG